MKQRVVVLGAGRVGKAIAADLSEDFNVTSVDSNGDALASLSSRYSVQTKLADLGRAAEVGDVIEGADLVISAVPGFMGFNTLKTIIEKGKDVVDISFFSEEAFELDDLAKQRNVTAAVDCGLAPGNPDFLAGFFAGKVEIQNFEFMVGGLHFSRTEPHRYLPTFSPPDVWEEYTRPARYVKNGQLITMPALSEPELVSFDIGGHSLVLEAFNTDGLRSLITTMAGRIPSMKEKTLRYPGHIAFIKQLQETGTPWVPETWAPGDDEDEYTILRTNMDVIASGVEKRISYTLLATYDKTSGMSSMSRSTGCTCTGVARCVLDGSYRRKGISPPSFIGEAPGCLDRIFAHLRERNILFERSDTL